LEIRFYTPNIFPFYIVYFNLLVLLYHVWDVLVIYSRLSLYGRYDTYLLFHFSMLQELSEHLGIRLLNERLNDPTMQDSFESIFPKDNPKNTRFCINFFTSIGLGGLTENLREYLKNMPRMIMQQQKQVSDSDSDKESESSDSSDSGTSSESESSSDESDRERRKRRRK
jgi:pre-mRNA-splicing factor CWC22